jgi:hypothetical protein
MSLLSIRNQVKVEIGGREDIDTVIDDQINFAVQEFGTMYPFLELNETATTPSVSGQFEYPLPTDLFSLWTVKEETKLNSRLVHKDIKSFDDIDETKTGTPHNWSQWKNSLIIFNSVPDDNGGSNYSIRIRYWKLADTMSNNTDALELPARMERGIRLKATAYTMGILNMEEKQQVKEQELQRWLSTMQVPESVTRTEANRAGADFSRRRTG